jgi:glycosyltransferase involved in cell wall biosynthesis
MIVGWLTRVPCRVPWYHTMSTAIDIDDTSRGWRKELLRLRKRLVYKLATAVVPASDASRVDVRQTYGVPDHKCQVFFNSLADPLSDRPLRQAEKGKLSCFGRLSPIKGQDVAVEAIALLTNTLPHVRVEFVGDGPSRDSFQQLAQDRGVGHRSSFLKSVSHDEVLGRMSASEATLVPSRSDNCPLVVIESLAVGTPVIASRVGGITEMIRDGIDGFLIPPDDPGALSEKIGELLSQPGLRESMSRNARQRFLALFEQGRVVRKQAEWFERIVDSENAERIFVSEKHA